MSSLQLSQRVGLNDYDTQYPANLVLSKCYDTNSIY